MNGSRVRWIVLAIVVVILAVIGIVLGATLVGSRASAIERGTLAGWWIVWIVIALSTLMAGAIAWFLVAAGLGKVPETAAPSPR